MAEPSKRRPPPEIERKVRPDDGEKKGETPWKSPPPPPPPKKEKNE